MKLWSIQSKNIVEKINEDMIYQPTMDKSRYLELVKVHDLTLFHDFHVLYKFVLDSFNHVNKLELPGIIYCFAQGRSEVSPIQDFASFKNLMNENKDVVKHFWDMLNINDFIILELEYPCTFNPLCIDFNDFQAIMPPETVDYPYSEVKILKIKSNLSKGIMKMSPMPCNIIQTHAPYIQKTNIVNTYPLFNL